MEEKTPQNPTEKPKKLSKLDHNITTAIKALDNPTKSEIANHVVKLGAAKHIQSVYNRLKKKDYLQRELAEIQAAKYEHLERIQVPLAAKVVDKALKDKELNLKDKMPFVKLVYDKSFGELHRNVSEGSVNIGAIKNAQIIIQGALNRNSDADD